MAKKLSVQEIILTLQNYWSNQGCLLLQAYDTEKGAGTMSPSCDWTRTLDCGVCRTFTSSSRWSLWRKPKPFIPTPPIPSGDETIS